MTGFTLDNAHYLPAFITEAGVQTLSSGANTIAEIRDRELKSKWMRVQRIGVDANADVLVRIRENSRSVEESSAMNISHAAQFDLWIRTLFYLNFYNSLAASISNYSYQYGYWLFEPTVADKLFLGQRLTDEEKSIADDFGIEDEIWKGSLPLPMDTQIKRLFKRTTKRAVSKHLDLTAGSTVTVGSEVSAVNRFLVLEGIAMEKPAANTVTLNITLDERAFHTMYALAASGADSDIPLFCPAKDSFLLELTSTADIAGFDIRYLYSEILITDTLQMLWGLMTKEEDVDLYNKVKAGIF